MLCMPKQSRRPGDQIIDRFLPDISPEERELAHERLRAMVHVVLRIGRRLAGEAKARADSTHDGQSGRIPPSPTT